MTITKFSFPTTIHFGAGARKLLGEHLRGLGLKRPLIVTDRGLATLPLIGEINASLAAAGLSPAIYGGIWGNPTGSQVMNGAAVYKAHNADCVVGIGGGAALDVAKVVGLMATHPGDVMEYVWDHPKVRDIVNPLPHFVALPTTSGTGSEVGRSSVISEEISHVKRVIF
ncbi:MAG: iron-containing alcohol dehydrogenase, partial [Usitatibacteraceae bacterium]